MAVTPDTLPSRAGRPALLIMLTIVVALAAASDAAARGARGPGPISGGQFTNEGLVLRISAQDPGAVLASGDAAVFVDDGSAEWRPFDQKAVIKSGGDQLLVRGTVGGRSLDELFPEGVPQRLLVRNGDGRATELDVSRYADSLGVTRSNRAPSELTKVLAGSASQTAEVGSEVTLRLPKATAAGYDVVMDVTPAVLPDGAVGQDLGLKAVDANGVTVDGVGNVYGPSVGFVHLLLPEGTYTIEAMRRLISGHASAATTSVATSLGAVGSIEVTSDHRIFALALAPHDPPQTAETTIVVDGLGGLDPTFTSRLFVVVTAFGADGSVFAFAQRDVDTPDALEVKIGVPAGDYELSAQVTRSASDPNGVTDFITVTLPAATLPGEARLVIPPLVPVSGTLRDPRLALASALDPATHVVPSQQVGTEATVGPYSVSSGVALNGFARSYRLLAPGDAPVKLSGFLTVSATRKRPRTDTFTNNTFLVRAAAQGDGVPCAGGCVADFEVPDFAKIATISGRVLDAAGKPVSGAYVDAFAVDGEGVPNTSISAHAFTGATGTFEIRLPSSGAYQLSASVY